MVFVAVWGPRGVREFGGGAQARLWDRLWQGARGQVATRLAQISAYAFLGSCLKGPRRCAFAFRVCVAPLGVGLDCPTSRSRLRHVHPSATTRLADFYMCVSEGVG